MRKTFFSLCLLMLISLLVAGCGKTATNPKTNKNQANESIEKEISSGVDKSKTNESSVNESKTEIRELAYQSINENDRKTIVDCENAKVEEYNTSTDHSVGSPNGLVNIKDKNTIKVTFRTNNEGLLGPITVYIDKDTYEILGIDLRD